ncbi:hypothetical protein [Nostoc sp. 'Peltigera membranacea cyanobiont' 232]|uniref:hypothetical protein n=1 Tax=Nostoc sp. 'Peltigera membranacea cyanobiont' 232 TaxID=2014531 RepID=UPI000B954394|nr:hypothetical protein [Nostoc sp. 'Peltigera membranacea cyanobiont' 232]OYE01071.1 hypothetical protein CDG79_31710 [Nostoc sp. 'Peltigera membranacea cyanobiont' 232]
METLELVVLLVPEGLTLQSHCPARGWKRFLACVLADIETLQTHCPERGWKRDTVYERRQKIHVIFSKPLPLTGMETCQPQFERQWEPSHFLRLITPQGD